MSKNRYILLALGNAFFAGVLMVIALVHAEKGDIFRVAMDILMMSINLLAIICLALDGKLDTRTIDCTTHSSVGNATDFGNSDRGVT